jgi:RimK family alpha-L-glutamate ligase
MNPGHDPRPAARRRATSAPRPRPRVGILATGDRWHVEAIAAALRRAGCTPIPFDGRRLRGRVDPAPGTDRPDVDRSALYADALVLDALDALVVRFIPAGSLDQIVFRMDALHLLADGGLPVINHPRAIERTVDKHWTSRLLAAAGIPTPRTVVAEQATDAQRAFRELGDVVVKPLLGAGGRGICRVGDRDVAYRVFRALEAQGAVFYVQEFVPHGRTDLRLLVVGGRVVAAARRHGDGWKTNVAAGGRMTAHVPDRRETDLALRACRAVGAEVAGVDLIEADDGRLLVCEVNGIPGWIALQQATGRRIADAVAGLVVDRMGARLRPEARL